jgi:Hemerythrin HHE cation binding domain
VSEVDLYGSVHKAQRARLFALVVAAGRTDPRDSDRSADVAAATSLLARELHEHGEHEDAFIHPLLAKYAGPLAERLASDHARLDGDLAALSRAATSHDERGQDTLYRTLTRFTVTYLTHLDIEEGQAMPTMWAYATNDELRAVLTTFRQSRTETENLTALLGQLPTLNPREAAEMVAMAFDGAALNETRELLTGLLPVPHQHALAGYLIPDRPA